MFAPGAPATTADIGEGRHAFAAGSRIGGKSGRPIRFGAVAAPPFGSAERYPMVYSRLERVQRFSVPADF